MSKTAHPALARCASNEEKAALVRSLQGLKCLKETEWEVQPVAHVLYSSRRIVLPIESYYFFASSTLKLRSTSSRLSGFLASANRTE
jgi:hypothetical protein